MWTDEPARAGGAHASRKKRVALFRDTCAAPDGPDGQDRRPNTEPGAVTSVPRANSEQGFSLAEHE